MVLDLLDFNSLFYVVKIVKMNPHPISMKLNETQWMTGTNLNKSESWKNRFNDITTLLKLREALFQQNGVSNHV